MGPVDKILVARFLFIYEYKAYIKCAFLLIQQFSLKIQYYII